MSHFASFLWLLGAIPLAARAQDSPAPLTVDQAVRAAVTHNPWLAAALREVEAARFGLDSARSLANPEVVFTPPLSPGGSDEELLVRQPLELNGVRQARSGVARARMNVVRADAVAALRALVFRTKTSYFDLAGAREQLNLALELQRTAEEFERLTRRQVELGSRPAIDQTQAAVEVARAIQQASRAAAQVRSAEASLAVEMGQDPSLPVGPLAGLDVPPIPLDRNSLLARALASRTEMAAAESEADAQRQEARLARAEGRPDLAPQFRATRITRGVEEAGIGIGITLPLLDYGSRRNRIRQAEESARAFQDRAAAARATVRREVEQAIAQVTAAQSALDLYRGGTLADALRLLDAARIGYEEGKTSILAFVDAQRTYRAVQNEYLAAQIAYAVARAELERATGAVPEALLPAARRPR